MVIIMEQMKQEMNQLRKIMNDIYKRLNHKCSPLCQNEHTCEFHNSTIQVITNLRNEVNILKDKVDYLENRNNQNEDKLTRYFNALQSHINK